MPHTADLLRLLRENNETTWTSGSPALLHELVKSLVAQTDELRRRGADEKQIDRVHALTIEALVELIGVCNQYLAQYHSLGPGDEVQP
jgi:hypothetical protein